MGQPVRVGIMGMGGFAGAHHDAARRLEEEGLCRVVCTCDPALDRFAERQTSLRFAERGVRVYPDWEEMLTAEAGELDLVTIPTPVPLHAPMHRACVERGLAVYLEKPPTVNIAELDEMLEVERQAKYATNVGFNYIVEPERQALKQDLLSGKYGVVREVNVCALWPRNDTYYARAPWAGRLTLDGRLVLDSCAGNAVAHFVHDALFWAGIRERWSWAEVQSVRAELYRGNPIQGTDTVFVAAQTEGGVVVRLGMTHAMAPPVQVSREQVVCEEATITWEVGPKPQGGVAWVERVKWTDGREEPARYVRLANLEDNLRAHLAYLRGERARPMTRLLDSRPFVVVNDLMYIASGRITTVAGEVTEGGEGAGAGRYVTIPGVGEAMQRFVVTGEFPSETGVLWARPGGEAEAGRLGELETVVREMAGAA